MHRITFPYRYTVRSLDGQTGESAWDSERVSPHLARTKDFPSPLLLYGTVSSCACHSVQITSTLFNTFHLPSGYGSHHSPASNSLSFLIGRLVCINLPSSLRVGYFSYLTVNYRSLCQRCFKTCDYYRGNTEFTHFFTVVESAQSMYLIDYFH